MVNRKCFGGDYTFMREALGKLSLGEGELIPPMLVQGNPRRMLEPDMRADVLSFLSACLQEEPSLSFQTKQLEAMLEVVYHERNIGPTAPQLVAQWVTNESTKLKHLFTKARWSVLNPSRLF